MSMVKGRAMKPTLQKTARVAFDMRMPKRWLGAVLTLHDCPPTYRSTRMVGVNGLAENAR